MDEEAPARTFASGGPLRGERPELVIFDCDGVLVDSEAIAARCLVDAHRAIGIDIDRAYVARHFLGRSFPVVGEVILRDFGVALPADFEESYRSRLLSTYDVELRAMPGVFEVLEGLAVPYYLATSSSPKRLTHSLRVAGLERLFEGRTVTASEVARGKPAPDIYFHVAARARVAPAQCLVIEDSLIGIEAGLAAGMEVWRFTGGSHLADRSEQCPPDARWHGQFASFDEFFHLMPSLRSGN